MTNAMTPPEAIPFAGKLSIPTAALQPWPLPAELLLAGSPQAAGTVLARSADRCIVRGLWHCTPGSFRWYWDYDETIVVVAGRVTVSLDDGRKVELSPGDLAFFERGQGSVWTVHEDFRKGFHAHAAQPLPF
jgi:uncharacterized cupin superfamily protein